MTAALGYSIVGTICTAISYVIASIFGIIIAVEAWLIGVVLNINSSILQTTLVQTGFSISLSVANLAFVLGIIVIALATILRVESYGIKKLLWKLVVMAILVNFGLVIMSPIFGLGNSLTQYFLNCINPVAGGCTQSGSGFTSFNNFATTFASAFNPQSAFTAPSAATLGSSAGLQASGLAGSFSAGQNNDLTTSILPIFGLVFLAIDMGLIVLVLGSFLGLMTTRYLYIAILAILLPFAWASWVFPSFSSHWKKWWELFIRWTFFAPLVLFFVYLALLTAKGTSGVFSLSQYSSNGGASTIWNALYAYVTGAIAPILQEFLQEILLAGLIVGGMIAADSIGIKMAGAVMKTTENIGKSVRGYVGKQSKKAGRATFRAAGGTNAITAMRTGKYAGQSTVQSIPLVGTGVDWAIKRGASLAGRAAEPHLSNKDLVEAEKKNVPDNPKTIKENLKGNMNTEAIFAHLAKLIEKNELDDETVVGNQSAKAWLDSHANAVEAYGFVKSSKDADKAFGSDKAMRDAAGDMTKIGASAAEISDAAVRLDGATEAFLSKMQKNDAAKMNSSDIFNKNDEVSRALTKGFVKYAPHLVSSILPRMKGSALKKFDALYDEISDKEGARITLDKTLSDDDRTAALNRLAKNRDAIQKAMFNNVIFSPGDSSAGHAPPASPAPSTPPPAH